MGILTAFIEFEMQPKKALSSSKLFNGLWTFMKILFGVLILSAYIVDVYAIPKVLQIVVAGLDKVAWSYVIMIVIVGYRHGFGGFWRDFMNVSGWRRLSKVNYSVLMCHIFVYQMIMGSTMATGLVQMSQGLYLTLIVLTVGLSYAMGVIFYMVVELPAANILKFV